MGRRTVAVLTVGGVAGIFLAAGCAFRESICSSGEYPVAAVRSTTGRTCVEDGQAPPAGFVQFPEGKVPQHVGDEWDRYWAEHMLDENGRELGV
ncbi:SCO0607 family lipoprotein [Micromonospora sp. NPDC049497]|uniref:SCO0607 family lipoprotein n=1 Tax=Micromonospora sp. NPDC049497 TaxID=3364273 RepID=UPI0037B134E3